MVAQPRGRSTEEENRQVREMGSGCGKRRGGCTVVAGFCAQGTTCGGRLEVGGEDRLVG